MKLSEEMTLYYRAMWENPIDIRNQIFRQLNEYVRKRIPRGLGKKALDLGSGKGTILTYLAEKGYDVTSLELDSKLALDLNHRFPQANVVRADVRNIELKGDFDLVTCIELTQNLTKPELAGILMKLSKIAKKLMINISNSRAFHGFWVRYRRFKAAFVVEYTPSELDEMLANARFEAIHKRGFGLLTPVSLFDNFRVKLFPTWIATTVNKLDPLLMNQCHLYYVEAEVRSPANHVSFRES